VDTATPNGDAQVSQAEAAITGTANHAAHQHFRGVNETRGRSSATDKPQGFDVTVSGERRQPSGRDTLRRTIATGNGLGALREVTARLAATPEKAAQPSARQTSREARSQEASVIHYAPTVVINGSSQALDLERRILTVMAQSGHELSEILRREAARQERTTF